MPNYIPYTVSSSMLSQHCVLSCVYLALLSYLCLLRCNVLAFFIDFALCSQLCFVALFAQICSHSCVFTTLHPQLCFLSCVCFAGFLELVVLAVVSTLYLLSFVPHPLEWGCQILLVTHFLFLLLLLLLMPSLLPVTQTEFSHSQEPRLSRPQLS